MKKIKAFVAKYKLISIAAILVLLAAGVITEEEARRLFTAAIGM